MNVKTFATHGFLVRTRSDRRYAVVALREDAVPHPDGGYLVAFARIERTTDSLKAAARPIDLGLGMKKVVIDTTTGLEV